MVKTNWLSGWFKAGKRQQRGVARAVGALLAPSLPAKSTRSLNKPAKPPRSVRQALPRPPSNPRPATALSGKWLASHHIGGAGLPLKRMAYWLYVPDGEACAAAGMPLLVMLHGCEQSATEFAQGTRMNRLAGALGYAVLYPQQSLAAHPQRCWKWYERATQQGGGDVALIAGVIAQVRARYRIDARRIYLCGMSSGAGMAHNVALNHPGLFAGLGLHSAPLFGAGHSVAGALGVMQHGAPQRAGRAIAEVLARHPQFPSLPTMLIQGAADTVVRPVNQAQLGQQVLQLHGLAPDAGMRLTRHPGTQRTHPYEVRELWQQRSLLLRMASIGGLGHAWSGGDASLAYHSGRGPDASRMLLDFFRRQRRPA